MAEPIKPVSRLEDASLGNSNAIAEQRRATNAERQSMAVERSMQRQYRRAVRRNDMQAISVLGSQMSDMGLSRTGGGGIQDSQENNRIASDRAFNRADQLNQAGGRGGDAPVPQRVNPMANPQNGAEGPVLPSQTNDGANAIEAAVGVSGAIGGPGTNGRTGSSTINPNSRPAGTASVRESRLLPENNPAPSYDLDGISSIRETAPVKSAPASKSSAAEQDPVFGPEIPEGDLLYNQATRIQSASKRAKQLIDEGIASTNKALEDKSPIEDYVPEPPVARSLPARTDVSGAPKAIPVKEEASKPGWWNDTVTSPEERAAGMKEAAMVKIRERAAFKSEYDQIAGELIEQKVKGIALPDWQRNTALGSANRAIQEKLIRAGGVGIEMDQRIRGIMAQRSALKKANERAAQVRQQAANLLPSP